MLGFNIKVMYILRLKNARSSLQLLLIFADLNVEHAQLLLFLFHSLNLMQKKSVLLVIGSGAVRCSEAVKTPMRDIQILNLSRLLLLLEYMMRHLYDAPSVLLEQVPSHLETMSIGKFGTSSFMHVCRCRILIRSRLQTSRCERKLRDNRATR